MLIIHKVNSLFNAVTYAMHKQSTKYSREGLRYAYALNHSQEEIFVKLTPKLIELMAVNSELIECKLAKPHTRAHFQAHLQDKFDTLCNELNEELKKAGMVYTV